MLSVFNLLLKTLKASEKIILNKILSDNTSGSTDIAVNLNKWVGRNFNNPELIKEMIDIASYKLGTFEVVNDYLKELKSKLKKDKTALKDFVYNYFKQTENQYLKINKNFIPYCKYVSSIFTLSNSKTLLEVFKLLNEKKRISIIIAESRPQLEGRLFAKALLKAGIKVELIPDALISSAIEKSDATVIGADIILADGDVVNKIGSKSAAIIAKHFNKPFYVLVAKSKFSRKKKYQADFSSQREIWSYYHKNLIKTNYYFEVVEREYITRIITN